jgi:hypothetical protein
MVKKLNVPDEYQNPLRAMMQLIPERLQNDIDTQNIILVYLKAGGEKMARHGVEIIKKRFLEEIQQENEERSGLNSIDNDAELFANENKDDDDLDDDDLDDDDLDDESDDDLDDY